MSLQGIFVEGASTEQREVNALNVTLLSASSEEIEDLAALNERVTTIKRGLYGSSYEGLSLADNPSSVEIADLKSRVSRIEMGLGWAPYQDMPKWSGDALNNRPYEEALRLAADEIASGKMDDRSKRFWLDQIEEARTGGCGTLF
jgi:hypothetical protein